MYSMYNYEPWEISGTMEDIAELEEAEMMVISDEVLMMAYNKAKQERAVRISNNKNHKAKERIKSRSYQKACDGFKHTCKKKGYNLKFKGQTRKDLRIVPSDALGWDKINLRTMGTKLYGVKVGAIFAMT